MTPPGPGRRRPLVGLVAATVAVVAALGAAWGPARHQRALVTWPDPAGVPPATVPSPATPPAPASWFTPLLLSAHSPERLSVRVPCTGSAPAGEVVLFATTRAAVDVPRLALVATKDRLRLVLGSEETAEVDWPPGAAGCAGELLVQRRGPGTSTWSLNRQGRALGEGELRSPVVSGLFTEVDPAGPVPVRVELLTRTSTSRPSPRQWALNGLAGLAAAVALAAVARRRRTVRVLHRPRYHPVDAAVVAVLALWWLIGPWFFDDGWLMATVRAHRTSGSFSNVFDTWAAQMPLGFGHHVVLSPFAVTGAPFLWWRTVPLVACLAGWALLRVAFGTLHDERSSPAGPARSPGLTGLAAGFLVFVAAWLMTLRPEPVVALLSLLAVTGVLAYQGSRSRAALAVAVLAAAVATTLHPSGCVAAAPLVVALPTLWRDARRGWRPRTELTAIAGVGAAVGVMLIFADTDRRGWLDARAQFAADGAHAYGVGDEVLRYRDLLINGTAPAVAGVLFAALALLVLAATHGRRRRDGGLGVDHDLAGRALLAAAALLAVTPSKWLYHFGSAAGLAALAIGMATARLGAAPGRAGTVLRGTVVVVTAFIVGRAFHQPRDPQYFMRLGNPLFGNLGHPAVRGAAVAIALVVLVAAPRTETPTGRSTRTRAAVAWTVPAGLGVVLVAALVSGGLVPLVRGPWWAMARTAVADARGGCTFAERLEVSDPRTALPLAPVDATGGELRRTSAEPAHAPPPELPDALVYASGGGEGGRVGTPWFVLPDDEAVDLIVDVDEPPGAPGVLVEVEWAQRADGAFRVLTRRTFSVGGERNPIYAPSSWRPLRLASGATRPTGSDVVRLAVHTPAGVDVAPGGLAVTQPVAVTPRPLVAWLDHGTALVSPPQLPLLGCTTPPAVRNGIAEVPDVVIGFELRDTVNEIPEAGSPTGPWYLAADAVPTRRLWGWLTDEQAITVTVPDDTAATSPDVAATISRL